MVEPPVGGQSLASLSSPVIGDEFEFFEIEPCHLGDETGKRLQAAKTTPATGMRTGGFRATIDTGARQRRPFVV